MINEEMLGAYLEGNLSPAEMMAMEQELAQNPELQALADDVYGLDIAAITPEDMGLDMDAIEIPQIMEIVEEPVLDLEENTDAEEITEETIEDVDPEGNQLCDMPQIDANDEADWQDTADDLLLM